ncbi:TRAP transporter large permease [Cohnella kolymensis]|uniref:TRAP transporter large permease n=1 Tax=Cohnella kolymensis TaxID=1590652 RepID=UPI0006968824|nr:TRAP transporter large permease [Cohnella kolymensis]
MISILLIVFFVALAIGVPVALAIGVSSFIALILIGDVPLEVLPQSLYSGINSFPMMTIPFFILASDLMSGGRLTQILINFARDLVGHIRGGLGYGNVIVGLMFSGMSGSALADAAGPGSIFTRMMRKSGYDPYYAGSLSAAVAVLGPIIPPSVMMVIYALTDGKTSVSGLFLAGIVPGILLALSLMVLNFFVSRKHNYRSHSERVPFITLLKSFIHSLPAILMPVLIIVGIRGGVVTPTEASAVAVFYALVVGFFVTKGLTLKNIFGIIVNSTIVSCSLLLMIAMGSAFSWVLTYAQVPQRVAEWMTGLTDNTLVILLLIAFISLIAGIFLDTLPSLVILVPVLAPAAYMYGAEPLQVAMVIILTLAIGMLTPPIAPLLFIISASGGLRIERLSIAIIPMIIAEMVVVLLVVFIPEISTGLPNLFGFKN